jgi:Skp family chaperone for outer membrane proteins|tara:strand:- start:8204 stop:8728 length:525 start_codon:yes stop_codon:yes gene_type:complete
MNIIKKFKWTLVFFFLLQTNLTAQTTYYLDFKYILNQSDAGKKAQLTLKNKLDKGIKNLNNQQNTIQEEEKNIIKQKKALSPEEYKKKVNVLRKKVSSLQKERNSLLETVSKQRSKARNELLKNVNPLLSSYMKEKNIGLVIDKKYLLLADEKFDITNDIMSLLNKKLKSIKLN